MSRYTFFGDLEIGDKFTRPDWPGFEYEKIADHGWKTDDIPFTAKMTKIPAKVYNKECIGKECKFVYCTQVNKIEDE